jgi:hypothetical protein
MTAELDDQEVSPEEWKTWLQSWPLSEVDEFWIARDGKLYACDEFIKHGDVAKSVLGQGGELMAEQLGWLRASDYGVNCSKSLSQAQRNKLWDWCESHELDYEEFCARYKLS